MLVKIEPSKITRIKHSGIPMDLMRVKPFDIQDYTKAIAANLDDVKPIRIKRETQFKHAQLMIDDRKPFTAVVSSTLNDSKSRYFAAYVMQSIFYNELTDMRRPKVLWHNVQGGGRDSLRDAEKQSLRFLVLASLSLESSITKNEKVRDLIDMYSDTPKLIVVSGVDPVTWITTKLRASAQYCLSLSHAITSD